MEASRLISEDSFLRVFGARIPDVHARTFLAYPQEAPGALRAHIFRDPDGDAARRMFPRPDAQDAAATAARGTSPWW